MQLRGKRIIVTGGARGIGACTVRAYVAEGADVASLDVLDEQGREVAAAATATGPGSAIYYRCDITQRAETEAVFAQAVQQLGGLDVLANIAGVERTGPAEETPDEVWDLIFDVNARGTLLTNQAAFRYLRDHGGRILNFGSAAGMAGMPNGAAYSASKGAVLAWTRTVAVEWARYGITVNALAPAVWTPMYQASRDRYTPEQLRAHDAHLAKVIPLGGRLGDPEKDLAPVMVFLASDASHFITGQTLPVDGGALMVR